MASEAEQSSEESQFVAQSGDEEVLWEITGILAEKKGMYRVKWAGIDPKTNRPWGNSWVKKSDVTPDVVQEWKEKQALKEHTKSKKRPSKASKRASGSTSNRTATTSTVRRGRSSVATTVTVKPEPLSPPPSVPLSYVSPPPAPPPLPHSPSIPPPKANGKRKLSMPASDLLFKEHDSAANVQPRKKKRKVADGAQESERTKSAAQTGTSAGTKKFSSLGKEETSERRKAIQYRKEEEEESSDDNLPPPSPKRNRLPAALASKPSTSNGVPSREAKGKGRETDSSSRNAANNRKPSTQVARISSNVVVVTDDEEAESNTDIDIDDEDTYEQPIIHPRTSTIVPVNLSPKKSNTRTNGVLKKANLANSKGEKLEKARSGQKSVPESDIKYDETGQTSRQSSDQKLNKRSNRTKNDWKPPVRDRSTRGTPPLSPSAQHHESASENSHPVAAYGESDVDTDAVDIMYPTEPGVSPSRTKLKSKPASIARQPTLPNDIPDIVEPQKRIGSPSRSRKPMPIPNTPSRSSLISKMKPRTPRSGADLKGDESSKMQVEKVNGTTKQKTLRPIPQIPPSAFHSHLPLSFIDPAFENEDPPMSSIEQFDSPQKSTKYRTVAKSKGKERAILNNDLDFWSRDVVIERGQQIAENAKIARGKERGATTARRPLEEIVSRHRSSSRASSNKSDEHVPSASIPPRNRTGDGSKRRMEEEEDDQQEEEEEEAEAEAEEEEENGEGGGDEEGEERDAPLDFGQSSLLQPELYDNGFDDFYGDDPTITQETQTDDVHLAIPLFLPEEDEESTQDLLHEMEVERAISEGVSSRSSSPEGEPEPRKGSGDSDDTDMPLDVSMEPQPGTLPQSLEDAVPAKDKPSSRMPSQESSRRAAPTKKTWPEPPVLSTQEVPPTASARQEEDSQESNQTNDSTAQKEHIGYMTLLNAKSEEIQVLGKQLSEERAKNEDFAHRIATLEEQLLAAQNAAQSEKNRADLLVQKHELSNTQLAEVNSRLNDGNTAWDARVQALNSEVEKQKGLHDVTQRHLETISALYGEETGRTAILRKGKKKLEQDLVVARSQTTDGVKAVREMLDKRLKEMEEDRDRWRRAAQFIMDKDARTNDDIRRRAAEEPEIRARCHQYKAKYIDMRNKAVELEGQLEAKSEEVKKLREELETLSLQKQLSPLRPIPNGHSPMDFEQGSSTSDGLLQTQQRIDDSQDTVFRCQWRLEDDKFCNALFLTQEELGQHVFNSGHVQRQAFDGGLD